MFLRRLQQVVVVVVVVAYPKVGLVFSALLQSAPCSPRRFSSFLRRLQQIVVVVGGGGCGGGGGAYPKGGIVFSNL